MKASENAINLIKKYETLRLEAYRPTPKDVPTIGWGHTHGVQMGQTITEAQAEDFLRNEDVPAVEELIAKRVTADLTQNQYDALVSLAFNVGFTPSLFYRLSKGDYQGAAGEFDRWVFQKGTRLKGLVARRAEERQLFETA